MLSNYRKKKLVRSRHVHARKKELKQHKSEAKTGAEKKKKKKKPKRHGGGHGTLTLVVVPLPAPQPLPGLSLPQLARKILHSGVHARELARLGGELLPSPRLPIGLKPASADGNEKLGRQNAHHSAAESLVAFLQSCAHVSRLSLRCFAMLVSRVRANRRPCDWQLCKCLGCFDLGRSVTHRLSSQTCGSWPSSTYTLCSSALSASASRTISSGVIGSGKSIDEGAKANGIRIDDDDDDDDDELDCNVSSTAHAGKFTFACIRRSRSTSSERAGVLTIMAPRCYLTQLSFVLCVAIAPIR